MKLEINKERFLSSIQKAEKIANKNTTLPVLSCLVFDASNGEVRTKATNLDISLITKNDAKISREGTVAVPAQTILSYLSNLPKGDTTINLELKEKVLHITTKSSDTAIKTHPLEDFPEIKEKSLGDEIKIKSEDLIKGLNSVWYSSSTSSIKPELSSVYIYSDDGDLVFVATDSFRLAEKRVKTKNADVFQDVLIPFKNVVEIIKVFDDLEDEINISFQEDQVVIQTENIYLSSRVVDGTFPDYKQIIPKEIKTEVNLLKEDFMQGLKVSNIFSGKFNQVVFSIIPTDDIFEIQSTSNELGETKNIIKSKMKGENLKISFNNKYINDCFGSIKSESISLDFCGLDKPMVIKGLDNDRFTYLVMPMNK